MGTRMVAMSGAILSKKIMPLSICIEIRAQHPPWLCILLENLLPTVAIVKSWGVGWNPLRWVTMSLVPPSPV